MTKLEKTILAIIHKLASQNILEVEGLCGLEDIYNTLRKQKKKPYDKAYVVRTLRALVAKTLIKRVLLKSRPATEHYYMLSEQELNLEMVREYTQREKPFQSSTNSILLKKKAAINKPADPKNPLHHPLNLPTLGDSI